MGFFFRLKSGTVDVDAATGGYLPGDLRRRLREIAASEDCKMHDLILEGVRHVVNRRATSA